MNRPILKINDILLKRSPIFSLAIDRLNVSGGQILCLAGANGSGKTSFVDILSGLVIADKGKVIVNRKDLFDDQIRVKRTIGYVPDDDNWLIPELTAKEYFFLLESVYKKVGVRTNMQRRSRMMAHKLLFNSFDQQMGTLSHGNKKKVQIIAALMHRPEVIIIDEMRNGLDPIAIRRAEDLLKSEAGRGAAVIAATHDLWWAERFADEIVMIQNGSIALQAKTAVILAESGSVETRFMEVFASA